MAKPLVSIITPTYNHEKFIGQCIESVLAQIYPHWEMIIVDDGSTDQTRKIIEKYNDPRIRYFYQDHKGISRLDETYNFALEKANGELVAILEGDDFWAPYHLQTLVPLLEEDSSVVLAWGLARAVTEESQVTQIYRPRNWKNLIDKPSLTMSMLQNQNSQPMPCGVVIKRRALTEIGGFKPLHLGNSAVVDYSTFLHLSLKGEFRATHKVVAYWRFYPSSNSFGFDSNRARKYVEYAENFFQEHQHSLGFSEMEVKKLCRMWRVTKKIADTKEAIYKGRMELLEKKWGTALQIFAKALRSTKSPLYMCVCLFGILAAVFHKDLETLLKVGSKLMGREIWTFKEVKKQ